MRVTGGTEPGAVYHEGLPDQLREADVNLDVALALRTLLTADGIIAVTMPRETDENKSTRERYEFCNNAGADLFVSVHTNGSSDPTKDGSLAVYFHNDDKVLAEVVQAAVFARLSLTAPDPGSFQDFGVKKDALGVILKTKMPGAVIEPLFLSNEGEGLRLQATITGDKCKTGCRRLEVATAIYEGILDYLMLPPPTDDDGDKPGGGQKCTSRPCKPER